MNWYIMSSSSCQLAIRRPPDPSLTGSTGPSDKEIDEYLSSFSDDNSTIYDVSNVMIQSNQQPTEPAGTSLESILKVVPADIQTKIRLVLGDYGYPDSMVEIKTNIRSCAIDIARHALFTEAEIKTSTLRGRKINPLD